MSFSRNCTLALALATGLAAPASAATWKIDFFNLLGDKVASDTFTEGTPTLAVPRPLTGVDVTLNGITYLPNVGLSVPQFSVLRGEPVAAFALFKDGTSVNKFLTVSATDITDGPVVKSWLTWDCSIVAPETEDQECDTVGGTYTLTRLQDGDPEPPVIPLPATAALLPLGLVALGALRRRKTG